MTLSWPNTDDFQQQLFYKISSLYSIHSYCQTKLLQDTALLPLLALILSLSCFHQYSQCKTSWPLPTSSKKICQKPSYLQLTSHIHSQAPYAQTTSQRSTVSFKFSLTTATPRVVFVRYWDGPVDRASASYALSTWFEHGQGWCNQSLYS